jgi:hypothetical protein
MEATVHGRAAKTREENMCVSSLFGHRVARERAAFRVWLCVYEVVVAGSEMSNGQEDKSVAVTRRELL